MNSESQVPKLNEEQEFETDKGGDAPGASPIANGARPRSLALVNSDGSKNNRNRVEIEEGAADALAIVKRETRSASNPAAVSISLKTTAELISLLRAGYTLMAARSGEAPVKVIFVGLQ